MRLVIISHTRHYTFNDSIVGWSPTIREIDQLATLFDEVMHIAPLHTCIAPNNTRSYSAKNVKYIAVKPAGGNHPLDKVKIIQRLPGWLTTMKKEINEADFVHIRCPAGISLVALLAAKKYARGKPVWVKYAGNWLCVKDNLSYEIQRYLLKNNFHQGVVTVNGNWPDQPPNILSFINPSFSSNELLTTNLSVKNKSICEPIKIVFVGRIEEAKGVGRIIKIANILRNQGLNFIITLIGDGIERPHFENSIKKFDLVRFVKFVGWQSKSIVNMYYKNAHFIVHPSTASEGWPKVLSEAMAHGVVPIASNVSSIPQILNISQTGLSIPPEELQAYADAILRYTKDEKAWKRASRNGIEAAKLFTYEKYLKDVKSMFTNILKVDLTHG